MIVSDMIMMASHHGTRELLAYLRTASPIVLLVVFVVAFVTNSIRTTRTVTPNGSAVTGPGGRPLPKRSRSTMAVVKETQGFSQNAKLLFKWLSAGVLVTLVADAAINMAHVIVARSEHWWGGQAVVVSRTTRDLND